MNTLNKYSHVGLVLSVTAGAVLAVLLFAQSVRTYLYVDRVLVPQEAERTAERQGDALTSAARAAGVLGSAPTRTPSGACGQRGSDPGRLDPPAQPGERDSGTGGNAQGTANVPPGWRELVEKYDTLGRPVDTPGGKSLGHDACVPNAPASGRGTAGVASGSHELPARARAPATAGRRLWSWRSPSGSTLSPGASASYART